MEYFPDNLPKGRLPDRAYFFNILHTIHPHYTQELVKVAQNNRNQAGNAGASMDTIKVTDEWWDKLNSAPFIKCKLYC